MFIRMSDKIKNLIIEPSKTLLPLGVFLWMVSWVIYLTWYLAKLDSRVNMVEQWGLSKIQITDIVKDAVAEEFNNQIPKLTLQLDSRYQKKNEN